MSQSSNIDKSCLPLSVEEFLCLQIQDYTMERYKFILEELLKAEPCTQKIFRNQEYICSRI